MINAASSAFLMSWIQSRYSADQFCGTAVFKLYHDVPIIFVGFVVHFLSVSTILNSWSAKQF
jgi:hypothetical protein